MMAAFLPNVVGCKYANIQHSRVIHGYMWVLMYEEFITDVIFTLKHNCNHKNGKKSKMAAFLPIPLNVNMLIIIKHSHVYMVLWVLIGTRNSI